MHHTVKWLKWFVLAFAVGFLFPRTYGSVLQADVLSSSYDDYDSLEEVIKAYHYNNNVLVNQYLQHLLDPNFAKVGFVSYPPTENGCDPSNVSTYCLALALNQNLEQFELYLQNHQNELAFNSKEDGVVSLQEALDIASSQQGTVDDQILAAENTLDLTLAVYNQVQLIYPVHTEMMTLIQNLEDYRKNLAEIRSVLELYPSKFNGATTAQCK